MDTEARSAGFGPNTVPEGNTVPEANAVAGARAGAGAGAGAGKGSRPLWAEEPVGKPRLPDPVRTVAVRAVLIVAVTLIEATIAALATLAQSWIAAPAILATVVSTVLATWGMLDVWITREVWNQRHGVVSSPSGAARALRRERRRARRAARAAARARPGRRIPGLSSGP